jgi:TonB family protein
MFEVSKPRNTTRTVSLLASFLIHCVVIVLWLERPPIFVQPSSIAWGLHGNSENLVYFPTATKANKISKKLHFAKKNSRKHLEEPPVQTAESARAGSENGSFLNGVPNGTQAMPALPLVFPDPEIYPSQLNGLRGDVIVEVTIDEKGTVTNTRILQSLQQDIDDKVIATLRNWRFKPASVDGVAISSRQDVHFHFPS